MIGLTPKQAKMLAFLTAYIAEHEGLAPSFEEIKEVLGYSSKNGVWHVLTQLEQRGHIRRLKDRARAIEILPPRVRMTFEQKLAALDDAAFSQAANAFAAEALRRAEASA